MGAVLGKLPSPAEYMEYAKDLNSMSKEIYKYLNFDQMENYTKKVSERSEFFFQKKRYPAAGPASL